MFGCPPFAHDHPCQRTRQTFLLSGLGGRVEKLLKIRAVLAGGLFNPETAGLSGGIKAWWSGDTACLIKMIFVFKGLDSKVGKG